MSDAPLHPRRIRAALEYLQQGPLNSELLPGEVIALGAISTEVLVTCRTALHWIAQAQQKTGLTPEVVDVGSKGWELLKALTRIP